MRRARARHLTARRHELGERRTVRDIGVDEAATFMRVARRLSGLRSKRLIDRGDERVADAHVDEETHSREDCSHHDRERERQTNADGQGFHVYSLSR